MKLWLLWLLLLLFLVVVAAVVVVAVVRVVATGGDLSAKGLELPGARIKRLMHHHIHPLPPLAPVREVVDGDVIHPSLLRQTNA